MPNSVPNGDKVDAVNVDSDSAASVLADSTVTLYFSLSLVDGDVIDSNFDAEPATFTMGDGNLLRGFEAVILGAGVGERRTETVACVDAFGEVNPANVQEFSRQDFRQIADDELRGASGFFCRCGQWRSRRCDKAPTS